MVTVLASWRATSLSVTPASKEAAAGDRFTIVFDAGESITAVSVTATRLDDGAIVTATVIASAVVNIDAANVTITGLVRHKTYEVAVHFTTATGRRWTRTLVIPVVA